MKILEFVHSMRIASSSSVGDKKMNTIKNKLNHFIEWFKMIILSLFFGKFPRLVYEKKIDLRIRKVIDDEGHFSASMFQECIILFIDIIVVIAVITFATLFSPEIYRTKGDMMGVLLLITLFIVVVAGLVLAKFTWGHIRETSRGVNKRLGLLFEVLSIVNENNDHSLPGYDFSDTEIRKSLKKWLEKNRLAYETGECREWEVVCSFMDIAWPRLAEDVRLYITSELSAVAISEWPYKLRVIRVNRRVSVEDLKKILTNKKGLVERPEGSTIFTGKAFVGHEEHHFFEFKDVSPNSTTLNRLKFKKVEGLETDGDLSFDKEDNSGYLEEGSYVVFFTKR